MKKILIVVMLLIFSPCVYALDFHFAPKGVEDSFIPNGNLLLYFPNQYEEEKGQFYLQYHSGSGSADLKQDDSLSITDEDKYSLKHKIDLTISDLVLGMDLKLETGSMSFGIIQESSKFDVNNPESDLKSSCRDMIVDLIEDNLGTSGTLISTVNITELCWAWYTKSFESRKQKISIQYVKKEDEEKTFWIRLNNVDHEYSSSYKTFKVVTDEISSSTVQDLIQKLENAELSLEDEEIHNNNYSISYTDVIVGAKKQLKPNIKGGIVISPSVAGRDGSGDDEYKAGHGTILMASIGHTKDQFSGGFTYQTESRNNSAASAGGSTIYLTGEYKLEETDSIGGMYTSGTYKEYLESGEESSQGDTNETLIYLKWNRIIPKDNYHFFVSLGSLNSSNKLINASANLFGVGITMKL